MAISLGWNGGNRVVTLQRQHCAEFVRLGWGSVALQQVVVAIERLQRQPLDLLAVAGDRDFGPHSLGLTRDTQPHPFTRRGIDDLQQAGRQRATHTECRRGMVVAESWAAYLAHTVQAARMRAEIAPCAPWPSGWTAG